MSLWDLKTFISFISTGKTPGNLAPCSRTPLCLVSTSCISFCIALSPSLTICAPHTGKPIWWYSVLFYIRVSTLDALCDYKFFLPFTHAWKIFQPNYFLANIFSLIYHNEKFQITFELPLLTSVTLHSPSVSTPNWDKMSTKMLS